jgi:hypothetical protein
VAGRVVTPLAELVSGWQSATRVCMPSVAEDDCACPIAAQCGIVRQHEEAAPLPGLENCPGLNRLETCMSAVQSAAVPGNMFSADTHDEACLMGCQRALCCVSTH